MISRVTTMICLDKNDGDDSNNMKKSSKNRLLMGEYLWRIYG